MQPSYRCWFLLPLSLCLLMWMGCAPSDNGSAVSETPSEGEAPAESTAATPSSGDTPVESTAATQSEIDLQLVDRAAYDAVIAKHQGKVVLADFWATRCPPCVEQFPHTVELSQQFDSDQFAVVSVSMDEPEDRDKVLGFLKDQGATFDNLLSDYGVGGEGVTAFEIEDGPCLSTGCTTAADRCGIRRMTAGVWNRSFSSCSTNRP